MRLLCALIQDRLITKSADVSQSIRNYLYIYIYINIYPYIPYSFFLTLPVRLRLGSVVLRFILYRPTTIPHTRFFLSTIPVSVIFVIVNKQHALIEVFVSHHGLLFLQDILYGTGTVLIQSSYGDVLSSFVCRLFITFFEQIRMKHRHKIPFRCRENARDHRQRKTNDRMKIEMYTFYNLEVIL